MIFSKKITKLIFSFFSKGGPFDAATIFFSIFQKFTIIQDLTIFQDFMIFQNFTIFLFENSFTGEQAVTVINKVMDFDYSSHKSVDMPWYSRYSQLMC